MQTLFTITSLPQVCTWWENPPVALRKDRRGINTQMYTQLHTELQMHLPGESCIFCTKKLSQNKSPAHILTSQTPADRLKSIKEIIQLWQSRKNNCKRINASYPGLIRPISESERRNAFKSSRPWVHTEVINRNPPQCAVTVGCGIR